MWDQLLFSLCGLLAVYGIFKATAAGNGLAVILFISMLGGLACWFVDPLALFYHNIALIAVFTAGMLVLVFTSSKLHVNSKQRLLFLLMSAPLVLSFFFKFLRLSGSEWFRYSLVLTLTIWIYLFIDRRSYDAIWAASTCLAIVALAYLT